MPAVPQQVSSEAGLQTLLTESCEEALKDTHYPFTCSASTYEAPTVSKCWEYKDESNSVPALLWLTISWETLMST